MMPPITEDEAIDFFAIMFKGRHHIPGKLKQVGATGWRVNYYVGDLGAATADSDYLTRAVFLAHDRCVRLCVLQGGPGSVAIEIYPRDPTCSTIIYGHPTLEQAIEKWRANHPPRVSE